MLIVIGTAKRIVHLGHLMLIYTISNMMRVLLFVAVVVAVVVVVVVAAVVVAVVE